MRQADRTPQLPQAPPPQPAAHDPACLLHHPPCTLARTAPSLAKPAHLQGLLDLEGNALTPILVSLVKKDAGLLDAFGKGASDDIQTAKTELYRQMTNDPSQPEGSPESAAPLMSPPPSPKPHGASDSGAPAGLFEKK